MKRIHRSLLVAASIVGWSAPSLAQRQTAIGPGVTVLSPTGSLNGVDMSGSGTTGTLTVGVVGGVATDILSSNNPYVAGPVALSTATSSQGSIVFNSSSTVFGAIGVSQPGGPFLLNISGGNSGATVNFLGSVYATTLNVSGTGAVNFASGTNITATNFAADGTISLAPNTTLIGALTTTAGANTGTLNLANGSVLNGAVGGAVGTRAINVTGGSNLSGVSASITGAANAYAISLGTNTLNVGGSMILANAGTGGVVNTTLASTSISGNIRPTGSTNLGPNLTVNVLVPAATVMPVGSQFNIIQTQAGTLQNGTNGSVVTVLDPSNPLYSFSAVPPAGTIAGQVTVRLDRLPFMVAVTPPAGAVLPPSRPIAAAAVPALVAIIPTVAAGSDILTALAAIDTMTDPAAVVSAVAQLSPSTASLAAPSVTFQATRMFQNLALSRLDTAPCQQPTVTDANRPSGANIDPATCMGQDQRASWWLKGFAYTSGQGARAPFGGYSATIYGTMVGYDMPLDPDNRVGLGIGYSASAISERSGGNTTNFDSYQATAYASHKSGPWFVDGDLSFGWNNYTGRRNIAFPGIIRSATSSYSGQDYSAFVATGFNHRHAAGVAAIHQHAVGWLQRKRGRGAEPASWRAAL